MNSSWGRDAQHLTEKRFSSYMFSLHMFSCSGCRQTGSSQCHMPADQSVTETTCSFRMALGDSFCCHSFAWSSRGRGSSDSHYVDYKSLRFPTGECALSTSLCLQGIQSGMFQKQLLERRVELNLDVAEDHSRLVIEKLLSTLIAHSLRDDSENYAWEEIFF